MYTVHQKERQPETTKITSEQGKTYENAKCINQEPLAIVFPRQCMGLHHCCPGASLAVEVGSLKHYFLASVVSSIWAISSINFSLATGKVVGNLLKV